jgi:hypothetical protein
MGATESRVGAAENRADAADVRPQTEWVDPTTHAAENADVADTDADADADYAERMTRARVRQLEIVREFKAQLNLVLWDHAGKQLRQSDDAFQCVVVLRAACALHMRTLASILHIVEDNSTSTWSAEVTGRSSEFCNMVGIDVEPLVALHRFCDFVIGSSDDMWTLDDVELLCVYACCRVVSRVLHEFLSKRASTTRAPYRLSSTRRNCA